MSVFFKGKNIENLNKDAFEAVKQAVLWRLRKQFQVEIEILKGKLARGEITVEQARRQFAELKQKFLAKQREIEKQLPAETLSQKVEFSPFSGILSFLPPH